jgi:hypothetical protein
MGTATSLTASARSLSPAIGRCAARSRRTSSASTCASPPGPARHPRAVPGNQLVQPGDPRDPLSQPHPGQPPTHHIDQLDIVMVLGPVVPNEQHPSPPASVNTTSAARRSITSGLMVKCSPRRHVIPSAVSAPDHHQGHGLTLGLTNSSRGECAPASSYHTEVCPNTDPAGPISRPRPRCARPGGSHRPPGGPLRRFPPPRPTRRRPWPARSPARPAAGSRRDRSPGRASPGGRWKG